MKTYQGLGGAISSIEDPIVRAAVQRIDAQNREFSAAITNLSSNKSADTARVVVARPTIPTTASGIKGDEIVKAFNTDLTDQTDGLASLPLNNRPLFGNVLACVYLKEVSGGPVSVLCTLEWTDGGGKTLDIFDTTLLSSGILTAAIPLYTDGATSINITLTVGAGLTYDLHTNLVAL